jgi:lysophospholipase L1-like esterase
MYQTNEKLNEMIKQIESTCSLFNNIYFLNYSKMNSTYQHAVYFKDNLHLNLAGAKVFSKVIAEELKEIIYRQ